MHPVRCLSPERSCRGLLPRLGVAACLGLVLLLAGCVRHEPKADLVLINGTEPESLDPAICTGQPDGRVAAGLFEGLTRLDPVTAEPSPGIAERWEISPDGLRYRFFLRTNALWSTGEPITSEDVVYSWRRVIDPATAADYAGQLYYVRNGEPISTGKIKDLTQLGCAPCTRIWWKSSWRIPPHFFSSSAPSEPWRSCPADHREIWRSMADGQAAPHQWMLHPGELAGER
jgi:hypothetical protein